MLKPWLIPGHIVSAVAALKKAVAFHFQTPSVEDRLTYTKVNGWRAAQLIRGGGEVIYDLDGAQGQGLLLPFGGESPCKRRNYAGEEIYGGAI